MAIALSGFRRSERIALLALVFGVAMAYFLATRPLQPWVLLLLAILVALGVDGIVRSEPGARLAAPGDTAGFLFLPVLFALASGLLLADIVPGYWRPIAAVATAVVFAFVVRAEVDTIHPQHRGFIAARLALNVVTYVTASALFAVLFTFEVDLLASVILAALVSTLLAVEILREPELDPAEMLLFGGVIGLVVGEVRWALYFLPLEGYLAGLGLLLTFYLASGLMRAHLVGHLGWYEGFEYGAVTAAGVAVVVGAKLLGAE